MTEPPRKFFHISPDRCGEHQLQKLFTEHGHIARCHQGGLIAENIAWANATGEKPLTRWPHAVLLSGMYRLGPWWRPPLEGWRSFELLDRHYPDACFIMTTRSIEGWILDRMTCDDGLTTRIYAAEHRVSEEALMEIWAEDWESHLDAVQAYFGDDPRLICVDIDKEKPQDLVERLAPFLNFDHPSKSENWPAEPGKPLAERLAMMLDNSHQLLAPPDLDLAEDVATFCIGRVRLCPEYKEPKGEIQNKRGHSVYTYHWDGGERLKKADGSAASLLVGPQPGRPHDIAICAPEPFTKLQRAEGVINDALSLGLRPNIQMDMEDSRWIGTEFGVIPARPILGYNRRDNAENIALWPWPGQHGLGMFAFPAMQIDDVPFEEKEDRVVWRGMISGVVRQNTVGPSTVSHLILRKLSEAGSDETARQAAWTRLCNTSRMAVVKQYHDHPDFDIRAVMAWSFRELAADPLLAPYCDHRRPVTFLHRFRYQLCMSGYDTGSNFIPLINSQSVMLKEEDGWEVFYSDRFKPWQHYIPVARYCADVEDKLAWARSNPDACKRMSAQARGEVARLANPETMRAIKRRILEKLAEIDHV